MLRYDFFRDSGRGGGRHGRGRIGPPVPDPPATTPSAACWCFFPIGQEPVPITQGESRQNAVCT
jgi:hypothetical protein